MSYSGSVIQLKIKITLSNLQGKVKRLQNELTESSSNITKMTIPPVSLLEKVSPVH